jgi:mRNA interferase RelE/StbE
MARRDSIQFVESAAISLKKLPTDLQGRISAKTDALADNPCPTGTRKMRGDEHAYRMRIGDYRVVYDVLEDVIVVLVLRIGHWREVYR